ncbi:hypothetical protein [uncultured Sphingomonas sp.]|uniref:hypothetical protein n=1 Tax=uncultured Sphingomonas sp. TaxID=158754 RepID=UPI0025EE3CBD|nr:hypothetical protein [uncultured Sphingomonas sp.]
MAETPQERAETARVRRRWLSLGETVAILAVVISALTFWNTWRERTNNEAEKAAEVASSSRRASTLTLGATPDKGGHRLSLVPRGEAQAVQSQTVYFPTPLKVTPADTSGDARIERDWFDSALVDAREAAKVAERPGDSRLPVLIETRYLTDGDPHVDRAVYEVGYATSHSLLGRTSIELRGLSRIGAASSIAAGQKRIDGLWATLMKAPPAK